MKFFKTLLKPFLVALSSGAVFTAPLAGAQETDDRPLLLMQLQSGSVTIELRPDLAPQHVARILELVDAQFYDGIVFHRVIDGFMAQTGDPTGTGTGGSGQKLRAEFSAQPHVRGTVSMARTSDPNSADSQFFIVFQPSPWLDRNYTVFGQVVDGMEHVDAIKRGDDASGMVTNPDRIISLRRL